MAFPGSTQPSTSTAPTVRPGLKWSLEAANKAYAEGAFIRVGGSATSKRFLSGACRKWLSGDVGESSAIFVTTFQPAPGAGAINGRITGTPDDVYAALVSAGVSADAARNAVQLAISAQNFETTHAQQFQEEIRYRNTVKVAKSERTVIEGYNWDQFLWLAANVKLAIPTIKATAAEERAGAPSGAPSGARGISARALSLVDKWKALAPTQRNGSVYLNVSNMDPVTLKGANKAKPPGPKSSKIKGVLGTGIYLSSNNIDSYRTALAAWAQGVGADPANPGSRPENITDPKYTAAIAEMERQLSGQAAPGPIAGVTFGATQSFQPGQSFQPTPAAQAAPSSFQPGQSFQAAPSSFQAAPSSFQPVASPQYQQPLPVGTYGGFRAQ